MFYFTYVKFLCINVLYSHMRMYSERTEDKVLKNPKVKYVLALPVGPPARWGGLRMEVGG